MHTKLESFLKFWRTVFFGLVLLLIAKSCIAQCLQADIILIGDFSGSMKSYDQTVRQAMLSFVERFDLSKSGVQMAVITFSTESTVDCALSDDRAALEKSILSASSNYHSTRLDLALRMAGIELLGSRPSAQNIVVMITDGMPSNYPLTYETAMLLKEQMNTIVYGVLIGDYTEESMRDLMNLCTVGCFEMAGWENLVQVLKELDVCL